MLTIVHSGQTGVERGAHRAALTMGLPITGYMPAGARDELGPLPPTVQAHLRMHPERGPRRALFAKFAMASAVLIVVPEASISMRFIAMAEIIKAARSTSGRLMICDPATDAERVVTWTRTLAAEQSDPIKLMVHGPRATRWQDGERVAWQIVGAIGSAITMLGA
jgi:Circularly permutated YpsA SLOG family